ncbi:MAG: hypothetical protein ABJN35_07795 [Erythrobacter sp.]
MLKGTPSIEAAKTAFGDLGPLQRQIIAYYKDSTPKWQRIEADRLSVGPLSIRALDASEIASIDIRMRLERGVSPTEAEELAASMRSVAQQFPGNAAVMTLLAQAEFAAGRDRAAVVRARGNKRLHSAG